MIQIIKDGQCPDYHDFVDIFYQSFNDIIIELFGMEHVQVLRHQSISVYMSEKIDISKVIKCFVDKLRQSGYIFTTKPVIFSHSIIHTTQNIITYNDIQYGMYETNYYPDRFDKHDRKIIKQRLSS